MFGRTRTFALPETEDVPELEAASGGRTQVYSDGAPLWIG